MMNGKPTVERLLLRHFGRMGRGASVQMLEGDLYCFTPGYDRDWYGMLKKWVSRGVHVGLYYQNPVEGVMERLDDLKNLPGVFRTYDLGGLNDKALFADRSGVLTLPRDDFLTSVGKYHFALFTRPYGSVRRFFFPEETESSCVWIEGEHRPGNTVAKDCCLIRGGRDHHIEEVVRKNFGVLGESLQPDK
jgi:hypothetical protein